MEQPTKIRKIAIEVKEGETDVSILRSVDKVITEMKRNEGLFDDFEKQYKHTLQMYTNHIDTRADAILSELKGRNVYGGGLHEDLSRSKNKAFDLIGKLPADVFLLPGVKSAEDMKAPFLRCQSPKHFYKEVLKAALAKIEELKD